MLGLGLEIKNKCIRIILPALSNVSTGYAKSTVTPPILKKTLGGSNTLVCLHSRIFPPTIIPFFETLVIVNASPVALISKRACERDT